MPISLLNEARIRLANQRPTNTRGRYVLYWAQMFRRLHSNHALDHALTIAVEQKKPLVVFEGLKLDYPWASARHHQFILQGMRDNAAAAERLDINYWPFVETPDNAGRGLIARLAADAVCVVTDDYPAYIIPAHNRRLAARCSVPVHLVDGNAIVPLALLGERVSAAVHIRRRIHKHFPLAWANRAVREPVVPHVVRTRIESPFRLWDSKQNLQKFVASLPVDQNVKPVPGATGGSVAGRAVLRRFIKSKLPTYAASRNEPAAPDDNSASGLSAYLHYGHLSIDEVVNAVLGEQWSPEEINAKTRNKDDYYCRDENVNSFLDEAVTWRDLGYHWHFTRTASLAGTEAESRAVSRWSSHAAELPRFNFETMDFTSTSSSTLHEVLPEWARSTLRFHEGDRREYLYTLEEFEHAATHDELWNAAQRELVATGRIHNYLRMLWGKKVLEWSETPEKAYRILEHLNNKYALDGRDPNSYSGILWCFGLFDRPWPPERPVFGTVRYMSSANTARKFKLDRYYNYVNSLPPCLDHG